MKAKRILSTLVVVLGIVFLMNNASFAGNLDDLRNAIKDAIAKQAENQEVKEAEVDGKEIKSIATMATIEPLPPQPVTLSCNMQIALYGFCIESMNPPKGYAFPLEGGYGEIIVRHNFPNILSPVRPIFSALYFASNSGNVKIVSKDMINLTHTRVSYEVLPFTAFCYEHCDREVVSDACVGIIKIGKWGKPYSRKIDIFRKSIAYIAP